MTAYRILGVWLMLSAGVMGQEWTRFRGPNGGGQSAATLPSTWTSEDYNWVVDLPGIGHSSPVVWGDRLFLQSADPTQGTQYILCLDAATGKEQWRQEYSSSPYHIHARNSFASSTPTVDEQAVYFAWATPDRLQLHALTHSGDPVWSREDLGPFKSQHGFGTSPVVVDSMVILANLQMVSEDPAKEASSVTAFDKTTGQIRWRTPREGGKTSYSVPCLRERPDGSSELVLCSTTHGMFGLDLKTGHENWSVADAFAMRTVSSPVIVDDLVFGSTGSGAGGNYVAAINLLTAKLQYKVQRQAPYVPTPVAHGGLLFLWYDKGVVTCIDAASGTRHWTKRIGGNFSGSPVCAGDKVFCIAEDGTVVVLAANADYRLLGKTPLGQDSRSTPAIAAGKMYLRTDSKLFSVGG